MGEKNKQEIVQVELNNGEKRVVNWGKSLEK